MSVTKVVQEIKKQFYVQYFFFEIMPLMRWYGKKRHSQRSHRWQ